ncbi:hypothetical protein RHMOL_Rhmol08G0278000 [Rhododendron molle]|uniref:Uncharacterized protein n=1 Tax=Rhododendron molle TaxID=49168 RepID=A0ACC0MT95_RHOML|nr:hypothetical protein RHMOL_Rhmol08G0278000 [Rhododendron molle]
MRIGWFGCNRKGEKIDIYSDKRGEDTMEDWDQETLEKVVESKRTECNQNKPTESMLSYPMVTFCFAILNPVEKKQYGWFWVCPNGSKECHYRHAFPPGYVLKSQMKTLLEEEAENIPIEEESENQLAAVSGV